MASVESKTRTLESKWNTLTKSIENRRAMLAQKYHAMPKLARSNPYIRTAGVDADYNEWQRQNAPTHEEEREALMSLADYITQLQHELSHENRQDSVYELDKIRREIKSLHRTYHTA